MLLVYRPGPSLTLTINVLGPLNVYLLIDNWSCESTTGHLDPTCIHAFAHTHTLHDN